MSEESARELFFGDSKSGAGAREPKNRSSMKASGDRERFFRDLMIGAGAREPKNRSSMKAKGAREPSNASSDRDGSAREHFFVINLESLFRCVEL
ncbi:hypothetical protein FRC96_02375 [Lujinxingia vulgaris]|uniref:Uncharacterized protein n=1 Tax=Lujinxingia vulgaris TaxID=2600176 RepID=A0A5C6XS98_9DELT|nr:hypothetical protein [Lujinxingia vulgaris]TXD42753.1 hypothetical protein FRC96_02375 [Lujinxingia vulgaris]